MSSYFYYSLIFIIVFFARSATVPARSAAVRRYCHPEQSLHPKHTICTYQYMIFVVQEHKYITNNNITSNQILTWSSCKTKTSITPSRAYIGDNQPGSYFFSFSDLFSGVSFSIFSNSTLSASETWPSTWPLSSGLVTRSLRSRKSRTRSIPPPMPNQNTDIMLRHNGTASKVTKK